MHKLAIAFSLLASPALATGLQIEVAGEANGTITIDLLEDVAPGHVERITTLAEEGAYDGVVFHRGIEGFMAQTGDGEFGKLEGAKDASPHLNGVLGGLQAGGMLAPMVVAEIVVPDPGGGHQQIVLQAAVFVVDAACVGVDVEDGGVQRPHLRHLAQQRALRIGDVTDGQGTRGDLIQQWLKQLKIALVEQGHPITQATKAARGVQTGKAAPHDHDMTFTDHIVFACVHP